MNYFQILILIVLFFVLAGTLAAALTGWATRREALAWSLVCLAAAVATILPEMTQRIADAVGIHRGADLVFYCAVVVMLVGIWMFYIRLRHIRRQLTLLVRQLAIQDASREYPDKGAPRQ